jgi:hypothetical protein
MERHNKTTEGDSARNDRTQLASVRDDFDDETLLKLTLPSLPYRVLIEGVGRKKS